ncbi:hypothetical protein ACFQZ8_10730, partial [Micromonospora azadirachtae]
MQARSEAAAAGVSPRYLKGMTERVRAALEHGRLDDAAGELAKLREHSARLDVGKRLDSFREHVDAGYERAAQLNIDRATWLEKAASIEKAAAEGRPRDVHELLKDYEQTAGDHFTTLRESDRPQPQRTPEEEFEQVVRDRLDYLSDRDTPAPKVGQAEIDELADRLAALHSDRIDRAGPSNSGRDDLRARQTKMDSSLRGEGPRSGAAAWLDRSTHFSEGNDSWRAARYQEAVEKAEFRTLGESLRRGESPLPPAEAKTWQELYEGFRGFKYREQSFLEHYARRLDEYRVGTQVKIAEAVSLPDPSASLNARLDAHLAQISPEIRSRLAAEHLSPEELAKANPSREPLGSGESGYRELSELNLPSIRSASTETLVEVGAADTATPGGSADDAGSPVRASRNEDTAVQALAERLNQLKPVGEAEAGQGQHPLDEFSLQARLDALQDRPEVINDRVGNLRADQYPQAESIRPHEAVDRLAKIRTELDDARLEARHDDDLGTLRDRIESLRHGDETEALQDRHVALREDGEPDVPTLPLASNRDIKAYGMADLERGLTRARADARAAGMAGENRAELASDVRSALDDGRIDEAARHLERMRDEIDRFQIARRLEHARAHFDAGHRKAAELGMDRVTWLEHAERIELATAERDFEELHVHLNGFERDLNARAWRSKGLDRQLPAGPDDALDEAALQARLDRLRGNRPPADPFDPSQVTDVSPTDGEKRLAGLRTPPGMTKEELDSEAFSALLDRVRELRGEPGQASDIRQVVPSVRAEKLDEALRADGMPEGVVQRRVELLHEAAHEADYHARVEKLRNGDSPLPEEERQIWQRQLDESRDWPETEPVVMERYELRRQQYEAETQHRIADIVGAADRSKPLNHRVDLARKGLSKDIRDANAEANLGHEDRFRNLGDGDQPPADGPSAGDDVAKPGGGRPGGGRP